MSITSSIDTKALFKSLEKLTENLQKNILIGAVRAGAKPLVDEARTNVPERTKRLKKSIGIVRRRTNNKKIIKFSVTPIRGGKNDGWYAHLVEYGHNIVKNGKVVGYAKPNPFMRKTYENQSDESIKATREYLSKRIDKEIQKSRVK